MGLVLERLVARVSVTPEQSGKAATTVDPIDSFTFSHLHKAAFSSARASGAIGGPRGDDATFL